jgi:hypothetical protein
MNPKSIFGIGIRLLFTYVIIWGLWNIGAAIVYFPSLFSHSDTSEAVGRIWRYFGYGFLAAVFGIILLRFSWIIEEFAYPVKATIPPPLPNE